MLREKSRDKESQRAENDADATIPKLTAVSIQPEVFDR